MKIALFMSLCLMTLTGIGVKSYFYFNKKPLSFSYPEIECDSNGIPVKYPYDVHFPHTPENYPYTLSVPPLENRLTLSSDGTKATLFAPFTTKDKGWLDVNKHWDGKDNNLCWAASASNCIAWYLRVCAEQNIEDVSLYDKEVGTVFNKFRDNWNAKEGSDPVEGLNWYFTGNFARGEPPSNLLNRNSGGYLKRMNNVGEVWTLINLQNIYGVYGNNQLQFPLAQDYTGNNNGPPIADYEALSKNILGQLHYGPCIFSLLGSTVGTGGGHAVTCWGADFNAKTGLVTNFYIADNDDSFTELFPGKVSRGGGISAQFIFYPKRGSVALTRIQSSTVVYAPGVAKAKGGGSTGGGGSSGEDTPGGDSESGSCPGKIEYKHDEDWHWTYCKETNKEGEKDIHRYDNWKIKESSWNILSQKCVCGREKTFQLDITVLNHDYDGTPKSLIRNINVPYGVRALYRLDDTQFSEEIPTAIEPNNYNVHYKIVNEAGESILESYMMAEIRGSIKPPPPLPPDIPEEEGEETSSSEEEIVQPDPHPQVPEEDEKTSSEEGEVEEVSSSLEEEIVQPDPQPQVPEEDEKTSSEEGEKEDPVNPNDQNNSQGGDNSNGEEVNNSAMIVIISCVSAVIVVLIIAIAFIIYKKKKTKIIIDNSFEDDDELKL